MGHVIFVPNLNLVFICFFSALLPKLYGAMSPYGWGLTVSRIQFSNFMLGF
uniref:Uncharacterized protein n=1 Tax=Arundo donax TaxID=35708 RepID=A0A0A8ZVU0_ARUDO